MSIFIGNDSSNNGVLHLTSTAETEAAMESGSLDSTVFHSDLYYIRVAEVLKCPRTVGYHVSAIHPIYNEAEFTSPVALSTYAGKMFIFIGNYANSSESIAFSAVSIPLNSANTGAVDPYRSAIKNHNNAKTSYSGTKITGYAFYNSAANYFDSIDIIVLDGMENTSLNFQQMSLGALKTDNTIVIDNSDVIIGNLSLKTYKFLVVDPPNSNVDDYFFAMPAESGGFANGHSSWNRSTFAINDVSIQLNNSHQGYIKGTPCRIAGTSTGTPGVIISSDPTESYISIHGTKVVSSLHNSTEVGDFIDRVTWAHTTVTETARLLKRVILPYTLYPDPGRVLIHYSITPIAGSYILEGSGVFVFTGEQVLSKLFEYITLHMHVRYNNGLEFYVSNSDMFSDIIGTFILHADVYRLRG